MRAAPAVSVRCTGGPLWRAWCAGLPVLAAAAACAWVFGHAGLPSPAGLAAGAGAAAGSLLAWAWWRQPPEAALLAWDGQQWTVDGHAGALAVMLDMGGWLLLRLYLGGWRSNRWVAVSAREAGAAWHGLRAAVFALPSQSLDAGRPSGGDVRRG